MEYVELNDGTKIPILGLGTFRIEPDDAENAVCNALQMGYRLIDTANIYQNEKAVGRGIKKSGVKREDIYLTSKIFPCNFKDAANAIDSTLIRLDTDYLDLLLIHQPYGNIKAAWKDFEVAVKAGKVRSIGVSNFTEKDMEELLSYAEIRPVLNQIECHPYCVQDYIRERYKDIKVEAWYPLGSADKNLFAEPIFAKLAQKYEKSVVQIILRWHVQMGNIVIPGSKNIDHIRSNAEIFDFELSDDEMKEICALDKNKKMLRVPKFFGSLIFTNLRPNYDKQK